MGLGTPTLKRLARASRAYAQRRADAMLACVSKSRHVALPGRRVAACLCAAVPLALAGGAAPGAMAETAAAGGGNAFSELTKGGQETTPTTTTATTASTESTSNSNSSKVILLALVPAD